MKIRSLILIIFFFVAIQINAQDARKYTTYIVKSGETLRSIARKVGCKYKEIKNLNPDVDKKHPRVNTTLVIPNKKYGKKAKKNIISVKDEVYHIVKSGDTFYSIAKKYNVPISSINNANPFTSEGLKPGMKLRIPSQDEVTVKAKHSKLIIYKVKKGDTKWNIAAKNDISVAELERINVKLKNSLKIGDNIWIPKKDASITETNLETDNSIYIYHVVKKGEGLFRIAVIYDTTQEKIIEMNPEATKKLRVGMLLKIPAKKKGDFLIHEVIKGDNFFNITHKYDISELKLIELNPDLKDGVKLGMLLRIKPIVDIVSLQTPENVLIDSISYSKTIHISYLMPLKANKKLDYSKKESQLRTICTDFYMGAEIAIDSLKRQGLNVISHVYDTQNDPSVVYNLLQSEELVESDIIIGPFFMGNAKRVAKELPKTPIFTPSNKRVFNSNENLIKSNINQTEVTNSLVNYLKEKYLEEKIIIIADTNKVNQVEANRVKSLLLKHDSISKVTIFTPSRNKKNQDQVYMDKKTLENSIDKKKNTWVILISDIKIISSDIVNTYGVMANDHTIQLFTTKVFDNFKHIDYHMLGQLSWSFPTTQCTHLNTSAVISFTNKYKDLNHSQPSKYSFTGFDMTYDSLMRLSMYGDYSDGLEAGKSTRLSHRFDYVNTKKSYENKGVLMISFNKDLEYSLLK